MTQLGEGKDILSLGGAPRVPAQAPAISPPPVAPLPEDHHPSPLSSPRDTSDLRELIRLAADSGSALRLAGAGRWLDAGRPVAAGLRVGLRALNGIVEYVPGDLTMTAGAGSTLGELQQAAGAEGQFLPLDPWGDDAGTLGATLATASAGPLSTALGLPRDVVLGVSVVTGTGELIRAGGRVVKNVAGFDLVRLMVGAWGTLGAITEATVRLRALPESDISLAVAAPVTGSTALAQWLTRLRTAPLQPLAMELLDHTLARRLGVDANGGDVLLVRLAGNADAVAAQHRTLATFGDAIPAPEDCWVGLRGAMNDGAVVLRLSAAQSDLDAVWQTAGALVTRTVETSASVGWPAAPESLSAPQSTPPTLDRRRAFAHASVMRGVVRVSLPPLPDADLAAILGQAAPPSTRRIFERLPASLWPLLAPSAVADSLSRGIRLQFDPRSILNPGILGAERHIDTQTVNEFAALEGATTTGSIDDDANATQAFHRGGEP